MTADDHGRAADAGQFRSCQLWRKLEAMQIEAAGATLTFTAKLAREQGWSRRHAEAVSHEYRRFLYLAATGDAPATPSEDVDQAWHLHLTYSRHYWDELCGRILGRPLHHDPTQGGAAQQARFLDQYAATLDRYEHVFGVRPPQSIWPSPDQRFADAERRPIPHGILAAAGAALVAISCTALVASGGGQAGFGAIIGIGMAILTPLILIAHAGWFQYRKASGGGGCGGFGFGDADGGCVGGCGGGCGGCG